jgi:hypothetical protein
MAPMFILSRIFTASVFTLCAVSACAGGPRFVSGTGFAATGPGAVLGWYAWQPTYFTDPGSLSSTVSHTQADAMVAAAAAVWNVPTSSVALAQGGALNEHVSGANTYFDGVGIVFPADVQSSNAASRPIAVVYDSDGSITDLLLGSGASQPAECRQNGVTESVDSFGPSNSINHAIIVINGRCVAALPQSLTQLQYQLMRVFGRVLGLSWSQTNDNVFTGSPVPTAQQMAYWPVMHPMDILCGVYTYQCMTNPFTLRPDDLSALAMLYPITSANLTAGKSLSFAAAVEIIAVPDFPTGQGMELINVTVTRRLASHSETETWQTASGVSGLEFQANGGNPVTGPESAADDVGRNYPDSESILVMGMVPVGPTDADLFLTTESINPLYTGDYALGPYQRPPVTLSGPPQTFSSYSTLPGYNVDFTPVIITAAADTCSPGNDGSASAPAAPNPSGWWSGQLCAVGHVSWWSANIKAGHTWTFETTAVDENGYATNYKAQPVIGVWNQSDATNVLPTIASASTAMNALVLGMTQLQVPAAATASSVRIAVADQFGSGRPDFDYQARLLYADSVSPATVGPNGGEITISGAGFRNGNVVTVNGVRATVLNWTATQIVALAPSLAAVGSPTGSVDVMVTDATTHGSTDMPASLTYNDTVDIVKLVSAPATMETGISSATPFAVRVFASDGVTPMPSASVSFAVVSGSATLGCGASCILTADSKGLVQTTVTGGAAGVVELSATETSGGATVVVSISDTAPIRSVSIINPTQYVAAGASAAWSLSLIATQDGVAAANAPVYWSSSTLTLESAQNTTGTNGTASVSVTASSVPAQTNTVTGCVWTSICATWLLVGVDSSQWQLSIASGVGQNIAYASTLAPVMLTVADGAGHPLPGATVAVYQTVAAWEGSCPIQGRCPAAPLLTSSKTSKTSDANGQVSITPLTVAGVPQVVNIAASAGTQGFVSLALTLHP